MGLFYQFTDSSSIPILLGIDLNAYGFPPLASEYDISFMVIPSLYIGYGLYFPLYEGATLGLFPVIKYGQYIRSFTYNNEIYWGSRPVFSIGAELFLYSEKNFMFSIGFYYTLIFDDDPIHLLSYKNRNGYVF